MSAHTLGGVLVVHMTEDLYDDDDGELLEEFMEDCPVEEHGEWSAMCVDPTDRESIVEVLEAYIDACLESDVPVDTGDVGDLVRGKAWFVHTTWPDALESFGTVQTLYELAEELRRQVDDVWVDVKELEIGDLPELPDRDPVVAGAVGLLVGPIARDCPPPVRSPCVWGCRGLCRAACHHVDAITVPGMGDFTDGTGGPIAVEVCVRCGTVVRYDRLPVLGPVPAL